VNGAYRDHISCNAKARIIDVSASRSRDVGDDVR